MTDNETSDETFRIAVHELGHYELCASFGIAASPHIFDDEERYLDVDGKTIIGQCIADGFAKATGFQTSAIGWGGYIAEHLVGVVRKSRRNPFPLRPDTLRDFYNASFARFESVFTLADQRLIYAYGNRWRSFKSAHKRLLPKVDKIKSLAPDLAAHVSDSAREIEREKEIMREWVVHLPSHKISPAERAMRLADFLAGLRADDPQRVHYAPLLACLKAGQEPSADLIAELERKA
ncbi:MAG TPA: hypothetical protein VN836_05700 [Verrucomicrobiae bacterium]|nr:hypothetical protein [Verrucomicrobiae bacterium]